MKESLGKTVEGSVEGRHIHSFIHSAGMYIDEEKGMRRFYPFKLAKRKSRLSKGTLPITGEEWRRSYESMCFEGTDSLLLAVVLVCPAYIYCIVVVYFLYSKPAFRKGCDTFIDIVV